MSDLSIHPVYLSARAAIIAPERAIPVTLYSTQKWLPRLGPERWCLVMLLRSLCLDSRRRSDGTKRVVSSWRQLSDLLDVHEETIASWLKHKPIPTDKPWRQINPVDDKAKNLSLFIPRLRYAYETHNGKTRRTGFLIEVLMEDPVVPEDETKLKHQIEMLQMQQGELGLETHRLQAEVKGKNPDLPPIEADLHNRENPNLSYVNRDIPESQKKANPAQLGLHNASVNPENPGLLTDVKQHNVGTDLYVNLANSGSPLGKSEFSGKNVNELDKLIQQLKKKNLKRNIRRDVFEPIIKLTEQLLEDTHSTGMFFKVLNALYPSRVDLYVAAVQVALEAAATDANVNRGAVFVRAVRDFAEVAGVDLGLKSSSSNPEETAQLVGNPGSQQVNEVVPSLDPPSALEAIWSETQVTLRRQMTQATYDAIIQGTVLVGMEGQVYTIGVHSEMAKEWLENRLYEIVQRALSNVVGSASELEFRLMRSSG